MNLGAILHLNGKLQEAEANYLRALQLKPDDTITQSNLRKLWNIMEKQGLRTTSPWPYPARLPAICTPDLGEKDGLHARHLLLSSRKDGRDSGRLFAQRALLKAPELCIHLRPQFGRRYRVFGLFRTFFKIGALTGTTLFSDFFCSFITTALELEMR